MFKMDINIKLLVTMDEKYCQRKKIEIIEMQILPLKWREKLIRVIIWEQ